MTMLRSLLVLTCLALALTACNGGGGGSTPTVNSISVNPGTPAAGSLAQLSGNITGGTGALSKSWSVTAGSLSVEPPDFALILRGTAKAGSATTLTTTANTVYWLAPADGGNATITLTVDASSKSRTVNLGSSPLTLSVADAAGGGKTVTVLASDVTDLYQAAFRVTYSSAWEPTDAEAGNFLGSSADALFFALTDQNGFVPVAITRKGNAGGVDGSGELATIEFAPVSGTSGARAGSAAEPFDLQLVVMRNAADEPIDL